MYYIDNLKQIFHSKLMGVSLGNPRLMHLMAYNTLEQAKRNTACQDFGYECMSQTMDTLRSPCLFSGAMP
ncbi:hypothetical protein TUM17378_03010 [Shewanella algae]|nr:hypothetical protein TUM17378_03010 [Shewanella algae]